MSRRSPSVSALALGALLISAPAAAQGPALLGEPVPPRPLAAAAAPSPAPAAAAAPAPESAARGLRNLLGHSGRLRAAVVEPNRRPGGMKIWSLVRWVYGIDLHHRWVETALGAAAGAQELVPECSAATVLLGVATDRSFSPDDVMSGADPFADAVHATAERLGLAEGELAVTEFSWLSTERRDLHAVARDNADFAAQGCVVLRGGRTDMRTVVHALREAWSDALDHTLRFPASLRKAR